MQNSSGYLGSSVCVCVCLHKRQLFQNHQSNAEEKGFLFDSMISVKGQIPLPYSLLGVLMGFGAVMVLTCALQMQPEQKQTQEWCRRKERMVCRYVRVLMIRKRARREVNLLKE